MTGKIVRSAIGFLAMILPVSPSTASDVFLCPRFSAQAGYENNRLGESGSGEGSPFWQASPGLDVTAFGVNTESSLLLDYRRTQYTKNASESTDEASGFARWRYVGGPYEAGASLGGGLYRDKAWPEDDYAFWQARPFFVRPLADFPVELNLSATFRQTFYDVSVYTSAADRVDRRMEVRPGLRWLLSRRATVWAELYAEQTLSDASEAEYSGFGGSLGCEFRPTARLDLGAWAGIGTRPYAEKLDGQSRRDTPLPAGAWASYRLRPWLELYSSVDWEFNASTIGDNDYTWWRVGGGLKLIIEHALSTN
jgi:hypothetical protein